jgi:hypothetical protein
MLDKATQTPDVCIYSLCKGNLQIQTPKPRKKHPETPRKGPDIEDFIIDAILNETVDVFKGHISNPALRDPFKTKQRFRLVHSQLQINFKTDIETLRPLLILPTGGQFIHMFEEQLAAVLSNPSEFITRFGKCVIQSNRSALQGLATFLLFLSLTLKSIYLAYCTELLTIFVFTLYEKSSLEERLPDSLGESMNGPEAVERVQRLFFALLGANKKLLISPRLLMRLFGEYLVQNGFTLN